MKTAFFQFKRNKSMKVEDIEELLKTNGFSGFTIVLPREPTFGRYGPSLRKGFCFIRFARENDVAEFISKMDGRQFMGGSLRISMKNGYNNAYNSDSNESVDSYDSD